MADGKIFAAEFALRRNVKALDKILIEDSDDGVVKYAFPPQIAALSGYAYADSIADLPEDPVNKTIGYVVGDKFYIYVGEGGNAKDGLYQEVQGFVGPQGIPGPKGDKGDAGDGAIDEAYLANYLQQNQYQTASDVNSALAIYATQAYVTQEIDKLLGGASGAYDTLKEIEEVLKGNVDSIGDLFDVLDTKWTQDNTLIAHWNEAYSWGNHATAGYVAKTYVDINFVTLATAQTITGEKNFTGGFKVNGGILEYNASLGTWVLNGDLLVTGGVSAFSNIEGFTPSTITDAVLIDNDTIKRNSVGALYVASGSDDGGIDEAYLAEYLTVNNYAKKSDINSALTDYATQSWVTGRGYITGITGTMVTNALGYAPLNKTGDVLTLKANQYSGAYALDMQNSNIVNLNALFTSDVANDPTEGIQFKRTNGNFDSLWAADGIMYFSPNGNNAEMTGEYATSYAVLHAGNYGSYPVRNPNTLSWSGYSSGSYDGSIAQNIAIPSNTNQLTNGAGFITASASITGNAATSNRLVEEVVTDLNNATVGRIFTMTSGYGSTDGNKPTTGWVTGLTLQYAQNGVYRRQLAYSDVDLYIREEYNGVWEKWRKILTSTNFYNYALPITGGTVNGNVRINKFLAVGAASSSTNTARAQIHLVSSGANPCDIYLGADDTLYWSITARNAADAGGFNKAFALYDVTNSAYRLMVLPNGNIGIGTTSPSYKLHVHGTLGVSGDVYFGGKTRIEKRYGLNEVTLGNDVYSLAVGDSLYGTAFWTEATGSGYIQQKRFDGNNTSYTLGLQPLGGNVAIGGTTASEKLHVYGNLLTTGAITMCYSSDKRLKQNIRKVDASKMLMSLGGIYQYEYIDSEVERNSVYGGTHFGLIYQNVKGTALSSMCHEREDGYGSLNYLDTDFLSLIAGATMENISEVEKLKKENKALKKRVEQLEKRVA